MPLRRDLSGDEIVTILEKFGFCIASQRGSHIKLKRDRPDGTHQTLTIPRHRELDIGTAQAIFKQASRYVPEEQLKKYFFRP